MDTRKLLYTIFLAAALLPSCKKSAFLDAKPDQSITIPTSIHDCQALLDNDVVMNGYSAAGYPSLGETGSDDYYVTSNFFSQYTLTDQRAVVWAKDLYFPKEVNDWDLPYRTILYAKIALEALKAIHPAADDRVAWNNAQGSALFFNAFAYYQLAQIFAPAYDSSTAAKDWGLPLRTTTYVNEKFTRATVQKTYDQIIGDLKAALLVLPDTGLSTTRPSRTAAYGLLARVFLSARNYSNALLYADSCLRIRPVLLDYNTVYAGNALPFTRSNPEVLFAAANYPSGPSAIGRSYTDSTLLASYKSGDLRNTLFFKSGRFLGVYDEKGYAFCGLATDEIYLTRAECYARTGNTAAAMTDLNSLMKNRWDTGSFMPYIAADAADALSQILLERRKELLYRGLRWTDLRRLNKDTATAITLTRTVNGATYTLPPNDPRYVYAIPDIVIRSNQIPQNSR